MKKTLFLYLMAVSFLCIGLSAKSQMQISPYLMSQNGWMPYQVGGGTTPHDSLTCPGLTAQFGNDTISCKLYGNIDSLWSDISVSNVKLIRYGGTAVDQNKPNFEHYLAFVDSVRAHGMEPILQIPLNYGETGLGATDIYDTLDARDIVLFINGFPNSRNVKYWSIGNEPDLGTPSGYGYGAHTDAILIANYIKDFSKAMRRAVPSVPIKIIGPELANWKCEPSYTKKKLVDSLIIPGQRCDITGMDVVTGKPWIDYFSYHFYSGIDGDLAPVHRDTIINKLHKQYGFKESLEYLNMMLDLANIYHSRTSNPVQIGITEANINTQSITGDPLHGVKANSFIAGQYWLDIANVAAENKVAFITYWSAVEGSMGYMKSDSTKKPTYYHFQMGDNYQGDYLFTADNHPKVKAFASRSDYIGYTVTIMNQNIDSSTYVSYTVSFDSTASTGTFRINFDAGLTGINYSDTIEGQSTMQLQFDLSGNIKRRCVYEKHGNANLGIAPTCIDYCIGSTDAYLKDHPDDDGGEPSTIYPYFLTFSEDIWVRNHEESQVSSSPPVYANEFSHENPIWTNDIDSVPWVYAKVRNRGCDTVTGKLHLYYTRASLGDKWTTASTGPGIHQSWIEIGDTLGQSVVLAQDENGTYAFKWDAISDQPSPTSSDFDFCLLARFVAASDPMYQELSDTAAGWNAQLNNNIIQKNVILVDTSFIHMQCIQVTNLQTDEGIATIQFVAKDRNSNNFIRNGGKVFVDLGEDLWTLWDDGGQVDSGVRAVPASTIIEIVTEDAFIGNIALEGQTQLPICFDFLYNPGAPGSTYEFDVREFLDDDFTGAERYILNYPDCPQVDAGPKQEVNSGCEFEMAASPDVEGSYTWTIYSCPEAPDNEGNVVSTNRRATLTATYTTIYQVTLRLANGCYSTDFVQIDVLEGECEHKPIFVQNELENPENKKSQLLNCVPNPATNLTRFNYTLERNASAEIRLLSPVGTILNTFQLSQNSESLEVDCSAYNNGIYFYSLIVNGANVQTKKLVISK